MSPDSFAVNEAGPSELRAAALLLATSRSHARFFLWAKRSSLAGAPVRPRDFPNGTKPPLSPTPVISTGNALAFVPKQKLN